MQSSNSIVKYRESLPPKHPYRVHLEEHVDLDNNRIIRIDANCEDCKIYLADKER